MEYTGLEPSEYALAQSQEGMLDDQQNHVEAPLDSFDASAFLPNSRHALDRHTSTPYDDWEEVSLTIES
jgi:hypothetical protein